MFQELFRAVRSLTNVFTYVFREIWRQVGILAGSVWAVVMFVAGLITWLVDTVMAGLTYATQQIDAFIALTWPSVPSLGNSAPITSGLNFLNSFLPVAEGVGFLAFYVALLGIMTGYRFVKSWIPTLS